MLHQPWFRIPSSSSTFLQNYGIHTNVAIKNSPFRDDFSHMKYWEHSDKDTHAQVNDLEVNSHTTGDDAAKIDVSDKFWNDFKKENVKIDNPSSDSVSYNTIENVKEKLSHVNTKGEAQMVDVSSKKISIREAIAQAEVYLGPETFQLVRENKMKKGDVLGVARIAGIMAAKNTHNLIPLCHPLPLDHVEVSFDIQEKCEGKDLFRIVIDAKATTSGRTGVEMEALTAASVAALTIYDMCKAVSHDINISNIRLMYKVGGKRDFHRISH